MTSSKHLLTALLLCILFSCEENQPAPEEPQFKAFDESLCEPISSCVETTGCTYCQLCGESIVNPGDTVVYKAITRNMGNDTKYEWVVAFGEITILTDPSDSILTVRFDEKFTSGKLSVTSKSHLVCSTSHAIVSE